MHGLDPRPRLGDVVVGHGNLGTEGTSDGIVLVPLHGALGYVQSRRRWDSRRRARQSWTVFAFVLTLGWVYAAVLAFVWSQEAWLLRHGASEPVACGTVEPFF